MNIGNELRKIALDTGVTLTCLAEKIAEKKGKPFSVQNLSSKLKKGTANFIELETILEVLDYNIKFERNTLNS